MIVQIILKFILKQDPDGNLWCSTKNDENGEYITGSEHWGYCNDECDKKPTGKVKNEPYSLK